LFKTIPLVTSGHGQVTLAAGSLSAGTYLYALLVNGKIIDTKRMVIVK